MTAQRVTRTDMASEIQTIAVIGAGDQGRGIACAVLLAGYRTVLEDVSESRLERAATWIADGANVGAEARSRLVLASKIEEAVRAGDLIVEAVAEEMEMKIEMFTIFDKFAKPDAVFASSSPALSIAELAAVTFCPERCIGLRFVCKDGQSNALELVSTLQTSEETIARCLEVGRRMGKEVKVVPEREFTESR
ncbi:MAG TPA: 3-hydroxyacyl-CoA dehydrogenase NAD-binding domain-containing protein [Candidatus Acidoferrum sp.]|nr:3-hydroxyacyl-CoA dehydrogenase NAD-binding domain-containing protein [Candidatus Acidoferrum sp.]